MVTVSGSSDINITGNLLYANEPVTRSTADTLLTAQTTPVATNTQVLGVFTTNGSIILNSPYADNNLETDGSLAAIGSSSNCGTSTCGFKTSNTIATWTNVGGQIQSNEFVASITTANTYYDQRFSLWNNFFPPWFPSTSTTPGTYIPQAPNVTPTAGSEAVGPGSPHSRHRAAWREPKFAPGPEPYILQSITRITIAAYR